MSAAIYISILSLVVSASTLYLVHFRKASLSFRVGPYVNVYHADYDLGESFGLLVPVTFINSAARTGAVVNVAASIFRADTPQQQHLMMWRRFEKFDAENKKWVYGESAHALAIPGNSAANKMIWFMWLPSSLPKLVLQRGAYKLRLHFWTLDGSDPKTVEHEFIVGETEFSAIENFRLNRLQNTVEFCLNKELEHNRPMTNDEARKLLGISS